jgi:hypothetical protein
MICLKSPLSWIGYATCANSSKFSHICSKVVGVVLGCLHGSQSRYVISNKESSHPWWPLVLKHLIDIVDNVPCVVGKREQVWHSMWQTSWARYHQTLSTIQSTYAWKHFGRHCNMSFFLYFWVLACCRAFQGTTYITSIDEHCTIENLVVIAYFIDLFFFSKGLWSLAFTNIVITSDVHETYVRGVGGPNYCLSFYTTYALALMLI